MPTLLAAFGRGGLDSFLEAAHAKEFAELLFGRKGRSFELALEMAVPDNLAGDEPAVARVIHYEVRIGLKEDDDADTPPRILVESGISRFETRQTTPL